MVEQTSRILFAVLLGCGWLSVASAAEVQGMVNVSYQGIFSTDTSTASPPVSVALLPAQGRRVPAGKPEVRRIDVSGNRMLPAYITVQRGTKIEFKNRDNVYHQLFSLSSANPVSLQLGKADSKENRKFFVMAESGVTHFFCRIHNKSYARVDVVDTPYVQMVDAGKPFHFKGVSPGRWILRLAAPAAETQMIPVTAVTRPPPLQLTLVSHGGGGSSTSLRSNFGTENLFKDY